MIVFRTRGFTVDRKADGPFNTFNHTQFQNVNNNFGQGTFGQFTSAYPARIIQLAGKVYF